MNLLFCVQLNDGWDMMGFGWGWRMGMEDGRVQEDGMDWWMWMDGCDAREQMHLRARIEFG